MYELTCPSCKQNIQRPFLRVGAQAVCANCAHRFTIQRDIVRRLITVPDDTGNEADNPLLLGGAMTKPPPPQRPTPAPPQQPPRTPALASRDAETGMPIATEPPGEALTPIQPVPEHKEPSPDVQRLIARHRARRQRRGKFILIGVGIGLVVMMFVGAIVIRMVQRDQSFGAALGGIFGVESEPVEDTSSLSDLASKLPIVRAEPIDEVRWVESDAPLEGVLDEARVRVTGGIKRSGAKGYVYRARVRAAGFDVIEQARLNVALLDEKQLVFAQCRTTLALVSGQPIEDRVQPLTLFVPPELAERTMSVVTVVKVEKVMPGGVMFSRILFEPVGSGAHAALKITAYNPQETAMQRAAFYIRGFNDRMEAVASWRADWERRIEPRQRVELAVLTPVEPNVTITHWEVIGAGGFDFADDKSPFTAP